MKKITAVFLGIGFVFVSWVAARADDLGDLENAFIPQKVIILGSFKEYAQP